MAIKLQDKTLYLRVDKKKNDGTMPLYIRFQWDLTSCPKSGMRMRKRC